MDIKDKITFSLIFDLFARFVIVKAVSQIRYRPRIELNISNEMVMVYLSTYFNDYLPFIHVKHPLPNVLVIEDSKNVLPLILHIKDNLKFKNKEVTHLLEFVYHRTESQRKRYDMIDEDYFKNQRL